MAWFSGVNLGNLGDLGDIAGSLNKLSEQAASVINIEKGFDIEDFLSTKDGADGATRSQGHAGEAAAQPSSLGASLWDAAVSQVPKDGAAALSGSQGETNEAAESFIPIPIPSLFGSSFAGATTETSPPQYENQKAEAEKLPTQQQASVNYLPSSENEATENLHATGEADLSEVPGSDNEPAEEGEGWAIEEDVLLPVTEEEEALVAMSVRGEIAEPTQEKFEQRNLETKAGEKPEEEQKGEEGIAGKQEKGFGDGQDRPTDIPGEARSHDTNEGDREADRPEEAAADLHETGEAEDAGELQGGWAEDDIEITAELQIKSPGEVKEVSEAVQQTTLEAVEATEGVGNSVTQSQEEPAEQTQDEMETQSALEDKVPPQIEHVLDERSHVQEAPRLLQESEATHSEKTSSDVEPPLLTPESSGHAPVIERRDLHPVEPEETASGPHPEPVLAQKTLESEAQEPESREIRETSLAQTIAVVAVEEKTTNESPSFVEKLPNGILEGASKEETQPSSTPLVKASRSADQTTSAVHAALEAALAVSSPDGPRSLSGNHVGLTSPGDSEATALREQLKSMEMALQNAAKQAQIKADELAAMMQLNDELKGALAEEQGKKNNEAELEALREEYQHRLGAAERKVYALTKERDMLRREQSRKADTSTLLKEKDEIIKQVMAEGEELSKKQAAQEAAMKKLRNQLRDLEEEKNRLTSRLQVEEARVESIRKDKAATEKALQDAVERSAAELASQKDFYHQALAQAKDALIQAEARADVEARADIERKIKEAGERERVLLMSVEELRQALTRTEQQAAFREQLLRKDLEDMESRCQAAESRHEDLVARMPDSTRPLLRQIEAMQESTNMRVEALTGVERALNSRLSEAEAKAAAAEERERASTERLTQTLSRLAVMEAQLSCLRAEQAQLTRSLEKERHRAAENRSEYLAAQEASAAADMRVKQLEAEVKEVKAKAKKELQEEKAKKEALEQELETERAAHAEQERKLRAEGRSMSERPQPHGTPTQHFGIPAPESLPPVFSGLRRNPSSSSSGSFQGEASILAASLTDSLAAAAAQYQGSGTPGGSAYRAVAPAAALDQVEAMLRQKDGELSTYVARIASLENTRDSLAEELVKSTSQVESLKAEVSSLPRISAELEALRRRHAAALELMGERDEQVEELRADLLDVKQMYREQIDLLVDQIERLGKSVNAAGP